MRLRWWGAPLRLHPPRVAATMRPLQGVPSMASWPRRPLIYEINTWVWLHDLRQTYGRSVTLAEVPPEVWDALALLHVDAVWLMGVWERSPAGKRIAMAHAGLLAAWQRALPDYTAEDTVG